MSFIVGGPNAWKVRKQGEFVISLEWVNVNDGQGEQPAMIIWPARKPIGCVPYCLPLASAYQYVASDGYPTPDLATSCARALRAMGMELGRSTLRKLADVILDGLEDLVRMPPREAFERQLQRDEPVIGEMTLRHGGEVIAEQDLRLPDTLVTGPARIH